MQLETQVKIHIQKMIIDKKFELFDYTKWRKDKFDDMSAEILNNAAAKYGGFTIISDNLFCSLCFTTTNI